MIGPGGHPGAPSGRDGASVILAFDTATSRVAVAIGTGGGDLLAVAAQPAGYRHGDLLLTSIEAVLAEAGVTREAIDAIVVGTGPGAFTGLRVGLATAKALAHGLDRPILGVPTAAALIASATRIESIDRERVVLLLPAGPSDRIVARADSPPALLSGGAKPDVRDGELLVAVDLEGRAPAAAVSRGDRARDGLAVELLHLASERLARGAVDSIDHLVPEYVTLPRGIRSASGEVTWSRDPR